MARQKKTEQEPGGPDPAVSFWLEEIAASRKREKDFRKDGKEIRELYDGEKDSPFNIVYSNTETLLPSVYSQIPRPIVQYRYKDDNPTAQAASKAAQRMLEFSLDTDMEGYETFDGAMKVAALDGLLPGRGVTTVKYDAAIGGEEGEEYKTSELCCVESQSWDRVYFGFARKWAKVPWTAYEFHLDKAECKRLGFKDEILAQMEFTVGEDTEGGEKHQDDQNIGERKTALVYQIWDKDGGRKVRYVSPQYTDGYCLVLDDPLGLSGFFNCPEPLQFVFKSDTTLPTAMYTLYKSQSEELNELTRRIKRITKAIKARGLYDGAIEDDLSQLMNADDNELIALDKSSSLSAEKGLSNAIWFMPLDILITTLRELYASREQCKQVIYEVTGISDILRGATKASETLGAQQLKSQWGTLRIKPKQAEVQRYVRDLLRMIVEVAAGKFSQSTWAQMTGLPYLSDEQVQQAQAQMQAMQMQLQQLQQQAMMQQQAAAANAAQAPAQNPNPAAPMAPQQLLPQPGTAQIQLQQAEAQLQQVQQLLATPKWSDVLKVLQDDVQRSYKIDIETNSTLEPEAVEDQKNISDLMTAIGQFLNGVGPLVAQGVMPFETAQSMLLAITRRFRFGSEIEDQIKQMKAPPPQDDGKAQKQEQAANDAKNQLAQVQGQAQQQDLQSKAQIAKLQSDLDTANKKVAELDRKTQLDMRELKLHNDEENFKREKQAATESLAGKATVENVKLDHKKKGVDMDAARTKESQAAQKSGESKLAAPISDVQKQIQSLVMTNEKQSKEIADLTKLVKAPRKRTAIRDKDGRLTGSVDEVMQ